MAWEDGYNWTQLSDEGNKGDWGGADYIHALRQGGTSRDELMATRKAVQNWMRTDPRGREGGHGGIDWLSRSAFWGGESGDSGSSRIRDFVMSGTGLGESRYGNIKDERNRGWGDNEGRGWYTEADWQAGLSMGQTNTQIRDWLMSEEGRKRIRSEGDQSDILSRVQGRIDENTATEQATERETHLGKLASVEQERDTARSNYSALETRLGSEIDELKRAKAQIRTNAPTRVGGAGSAMGIRAARSPTLQGRGGFRGTLSGLTRQPTQSQTARVQTLNI